MAAQGRRVVSRRTAATRRNGQRLHVKHKKLVEAHTLGSGDDEDSFPKGCALIRANLHVDINEIETEEEWAALCAQALWLEEWRNRNHAELLTRLFGDDGR